MTILPGADGDTVVIGELRLSAGRSPEVGDYHYIFDTSSPVSVGNHDLLMFPTQRPTDYTLKQDGDSLVMCHKTSRHELVIEGQYRRAARLSEADTSNNEIEQIAFIQARVIWLTDVLFKAYQRNPKARFSDPRIYGTATDPAAWTVRPFSQVLPAQLRPLK